MPEPYELTQPTAEEAAEGKQALGEATALAVGADLSDRRQLNEVNELFRADRANTHLHLISVCAVWVIALGAFALFASLILHMILPSRMRFLDADDIKQITSFLFTGVLGGVITKGGEKFLRK
jgi:hypothetical protein